MTLYLILCLLFSVATKAKRGGAMAQQKTRRNIGEMGGHSNITESQSLLNVNELETRAKATVKDIDDLYAALQGLVPKKGQRNRGLRASDRNARSATSGTDTDTARSSDNKDQPRLRRHHSEKYPKPQWTDTNMNFIAQKPVSRKPALEKPTPSNLTLEKNHPRNQTSETSAPNDKQVLGKTFSNERLFASDTEAELNHLHTIRRQKVQRQLSLPTYEEDATENETEGHNKKSRFMIFRRHRRTKPPKKKTSSWRSFFSTLSLKRKKSKKHSKNKVGQSLNVYNPQNPQNPKIRTPKQQPKKVNLSAQTRTPKSTPRSSIDGSQNIKTNTEIRKSGRKRMAPDPPAVISSGNTNSNFVVETPVFDPRDRSNTLDTKSDMVQKKISAWYKQAVKETNSVSSKLPLRATRSHDNLLTDTEIIRKRGTFSSDTDSFSGGDRNKVNVVKPKVRKTRARRNRRRERARFHSCPNVKLVSKALDEAEKKTGRLEGLNTSAKKDLTDNVPKSSNITRVKQVEAKLSFGSSLDNGEPVTDYMKLQNVHARNWLTRQCSRTTVGCIRPLQLNLFYSESPSRETVHRSRSTLRRPKVEGQESGTGNPHEFAFKIRRSSSRRRKRRSFKRGQSRLPHQSPFYIPPGNVNLTPKDPIEENCSTMSKDSGIGSPDFSRDNRFATFPIVKRDQRLAKLHSESEDSGWASSHRHVTSTSDTGIQTDPVIVMTTVSKVRQPDHIVLEDNNSQSEA